MSEARDAIEHTLATIIKVRGDYLESEVTLLEAKYALVEAQYECVRNGIEGKNAETREAFLFSLTEPLNRALKTAEINALRCKRNLENCQTALELAQCKFG